MFVISTKKDKKTYIVHDKEISHSPVPHYADEEEGTLEVLIRKGQEFPKEWEEFKCPVSEKTIIVFAYLPKDIFLNYIKICAER